MSAYVVSLLKRLGIQEIHLCKDGREALKDTVGSVPDLILSDIHMAPLDGLEFVQQLRQSASEVKRRIPVIFMSADTHQETVAKVMALEGQEAGMPLDARLEAALLDVAAQVHRAIMPARLDEHEHVVVVAKRCGAEVIVRILGGGGHMGRVMIPTKCIPPTPRGTRGPP